MITVVPRPDGAAMTKQVEALARSETCADKGWKPVHSVPTRQRSQERSNEGHAMFRNRITMEPEPLPLPRPPAAAPNLTGFVLWSMPVTNPEQWMMQQWIYQRAFELAQAVTRPSI